MRFRQSSSFSSFVFGNKRNISLKQDSPFLLRRSPAYRTGPSRGCRWRSWRAACSAWPWQVQAGGAPVVALRQVSLGGKLRRQLEAWGEASSGLCAQVLKALQVQQDSIYPQKMPQSWKHKPELQLKEENGGLCLAFMVLRLEFFIVVDNKMYQYHTATF